MCMYQTATRPIPIGSRARGNGEGVWHAPSTFWLGLVAKDRDTLIEQSLASIEQSSFLIS